MKISGMPAGMPLQVLQQCITRKDMEDPRKSVPGGDPRDSRCQTTD